MNRRRWVTIGIGLITAAVGWWLRGWWLPWIPVWGEGLKGWTQAWGDTVQSLADGVTLLLLVLGGLAAWMGLKQQGPGQDAARRIETAGPLVQKPLNQLMEEKLAGGAAIQWVDRGATGDLDLFRHERVIIVGPSRIGKTREALELVRRAIHHDQVTRQRVYQPNYQDIRFQTGEGLASAIGQMVDPETAALLFVDDITQHFETEERRARLEETLVALNRCKKLYVVMTGRSDLMTVRLRRWLTAQGVSLLILEGLDVEEMRAFVNNAADVAGQDVTEGGRDALVTLAAGVPEVARLILRRLEQRGRGVADAAGVDAVGAPTVEALWAQSRQDIEGRTPAARFVLDALPVFQAGGIRKSEAMVLAYAGMLWRESIRRPVRKRGRKLSQALARLAVNEIRVVDGIVQGPDQVMVGGIDRAKAQERLGAFLRRYRKWLHNPWLRHWDGSREAQRWALFDLAQGWQGRKDYSLAIELYTFGIHVSPHAWLYNNRGIAHKHNGNLVEAVKDFDKAIRLAPWYAIAFNNRAIIRTDLEDLVGAIADVDQAIRLDPEYATAYNTRGIINMILGNVIQAKNDFDQANKLNPQKNSYSAFISRQRPLSTSKEISKNLLKQPEMLEVSGSVSIRTLLDSDDRDSMTYSLVQSLTFLRQREDWENVATTYFHLGTANQLQGNLISAERDYEAAGKVFLEIGNHRDQARAINRQAYVVRLLQRNQESTRLVDMALDLLAPDDAERGYSYFVRGCNAFDALDWALAEQWYRRSLDTWYREDDPRMVAWNLTNLGTALRRLERIDEAADCFIQAIKIFDEIQDPTHRAIAEMNLGTVYLLASDLDAALEAYLSAEEVFRRMGDDLHLATVYNNLGLVYAGQRSIGEAETAYLAAIARYEKLGNVAEMVNVLDSLGELYRDTDRPDLAHSTWRQALDRLAVIAGSPVYIHYFNMVNGHLTESETEE